MQKCPSRKGVPKHTHLAKTAGNDYFSDGYKISQDDSTLSTPQLFDKILVNIKLKWMKLLWPIRHILAPLLQIRPHPQRPKKEQHPHPSQLKLGQQQGSLTVIHIRDAERILREKDSLLTAWAPVQSIQLNNSTDAVISTLVNIHNGRGRIYMLFIAPFHKIQVRAHLNKVKRAGAI